MNAKNKPTNAKNQNIDFSKLTDEQLLNVDLDKVNFESLVKSVSKNIKEKTQKTKMYKIETDKKIRQKLRKERNRYINNILLYYKDKDNEKLKNEIKKFISFYKKTYVLNDFSLNSFVANNSDKDTKVKAKIALKIIKESKIK